MKLSIITVNLNNVEGLRKTIDSVVNQTWQEFEWIIVDGGSTDGSKELIEETARQLDGHGWDTVNFSLLGFTAEGWKKKAYPVPPEGKESVDSVCNEEGITDLPLSRGSKERVFLWTSEPDNGIYNAMNKGFFMAQGEYCLFLNSGDYFLNDDVISNFILTNPIEDVVYGYVERYINGKQQRLTGFLHKRNITLTDLYYQTIPHQGTFFRTSMFERYGLYDESLRILADRKFYVQSIIYGNASVRFIPFSIAYFAEGGISGSDIYEKEKARVLQELFPPRVYNDLVIAKSVKEIQEACFLTSKLYSALYKLAMILRKKS